MYSKAASVILEHQLKSKERSLGRFSAINSTPSSVTLLQPDSDSTVKFGNEWTAIKKTTFIYNNNFLQISSKSIREKKRRLTDIDYAMISKFPAGLKPEDAEGTALFGAKVPERSIRDVISLQREFVEAWQQLSYGTYGFVCDVDAIRQR